MKFADLSRKDLIGKAAFLTFLTLTAALAIWANSDLAATRAYLFMDEMIALDGASAILNEHSLRGFVRQAIYGDHYRYGQIFFNIAALTGWIPYRLAGEPGLIVAIRVTQVALLLGAVAILCRTMLTSWSVRALACVAILALPFTDYYMTQPKPEPLQLLFYALFLAFATKHRFAFGWYWLFLGLAFGAKISALPFCAVAGLVAVGHAFAYRTTLRSFFIDGFVAGASFLAGLFIAVPGLAMFKIASLRAYWADTFGATAHAYDSSDVNALAWVRSIFGAAPPNDYGEAWLFGPDALRGYMPGWLVAILVAAVVAVLVVALLKIWRERPPIQSLFERHSGWILLIFAAALILPIMMKVQRIWGFYLYSGEVVAIIAVARIAEALRSRAGPEGQPRIERYALISLLAVLGLGVSISGTSAVQSYASLAHRTDGKPHADARETYRQSLAALGQLAGIAGNRQSPPLVISDPFLYRIEDYPGLDVQPVFGPLLDWDKKPLALILSHKHYLDHVSGRRPLPPPSSLTHNDWVKATRDFQQKVDTDPAGRDAKPYRLVGPVGPDAALIVRADVADCYLAQAANGAPGAIGCGQPRANPAAP